MNCNKVIVHDLVNGNGAMRSNMSIVITVINSLLEVVEPCPTTNYTYILRPGIEYESEVWEGNKSQAGSLESIILDGAKRILGCSSKTCNEAIRGDMGLDTLQSRRDTAKLKWCFKLALLPENRYPKQLFNQEWYIHIEEGRGKCGVGWCMISLNI